MGIWRKKSDDAILSCNLHVDKCSNVEVIEMFLALETAIIFFMLFFVIRLLWWIYPEGVLEIVQQLFLLQIVNLFLLYIIVFVA